MFFRLVLPKKKLQRKFFVFRFLSLRSKLFVCGPKSEMTIETKSSDQISGQNDK